MRAWLAMDGEAIQLQAFEDEDIIALINSSLIDVGKTPASCSAICQASDISNDFKAEKKFMKGILNRNWDNNPTLRRRLETLFSSKASSMSSELRRKSVNSLLQLTYTAHNVLTSNIVSDGYAKHGQGSPLNFDKIIGACTSAILPRDMEIMREALIPLVQVMRAKFELTEADMDEYNIINMNSLGSMDKDKRVLHQRRTVIFSGTPIQELQTELRMEQASEPANTAARKELRLLAKKDKEIVSSKALLDREDKKFNAQLRKVDENAAKEANRLKKQQDKLHKLRVRVEAQDEVQNERIRCQGFSKVINIKIE